MRTPSIVRPILLGCALLASQAASADAYRYRMIELSPPGVRGWPTDLNNAGQVLGISDTANEPSHAIWQTGTWNPLPAGIAAPMRINDRGGVLAAGEWHGQLVQGIYQGGAFSPLPQTGAPGVRFDYARAETFNSSYAAAGALKYFDHGVDRWHAALFSNGYVHDLDPGGINSVAYDINEAGAVLGIHARDNGSEGIFIYENGALRDVAAPRFSQPVAINDRGDILGYYPNIGYTAYMAFLIQDGVLHDIAKLDSRLMYVNNLGMVIGSIRYQDASLPTLFNHGLTYDLNAMIAPGSGRRLDTAYGINDSGQIIGAACNAADCVGVLLDPLSPIPEPASWQMGLAGAAMLGWLARRRRRHG